MKAGSSRQKSSTPSSHSTGAYLPPLASGTVLTKVVELLQTLELGSGSPQTPVSATADELVAALLRRLYRRLPKSADTEKNLAAEECVFSGLNRSTLYELFKLRHEDGTPVIKTVSLKRDDDAAHGVRLFSVGSVLDYLDQLAEKQARDAKIGKHGKHP
jgi:hypothetical protein